MSIYLDPNIYTQDFVRQLQCSVQENMLAGVQITDFVSQGTQFQGIPAGTTEELIQAIDYYWNEVGGTLITDTAPNFGNIPIFINGQNS